MITTPTDPLIVSVTIEPQLLSAAYNPIRVQITKYPYRVGDLFYVEVYALPSRNARMSGNSKAGAKLITTLTKNGDASGRCTFDLGNVLASQFSGYNAPEATTMVQKDDTSFIPYYYKIGYIVFDVFNNQVKTEVQESSVLFAVRAALPLHGVKTMMDYLYQFDSEPVDVLTNITNGLERHRNETTFLSFFFARHATATNPTLRIRADLNFHSGNAVGQAVYNVLVSEVAVSTGGVYVFNVKPDVLLAQPNYSLLRSYSVWLTYEDDDRAESAISFSRTFLVADNLLEPQEVTFLNRAGGWDSLQFTRNIREEMKTDVISYRNATAERVSGVSAKSNITIYSTWLPNKAHDWLRDLVLSPVVLLDGKYVKLQDTTHKYDSTEDVFSLELTVSPEYEQNSIRF
ncbi:hypothetical protein ACFST9_04185 [Hymenobacter monticola]|uniref:DUF4270 family protein n=1 Tax=Hymenobacter monticola TaxID=1705399 RepID=A0ABY4B138_9BACT|nr:hypothetical protein [Hymenobacter monticola]UOE32847.1 hypothetical protein MTP16_17135 [Hymenobacter monticola]